ncbi:uncharacterized protein LOC132938875 [Metopolophium dirhodum]|uniref:uncharacterized protein LOC132938875 n=1 Tax=Metopolophium dirhodum TaxID=44670 RepID=UPI0029903DB4|nr:uncharacterized protein LOC132938875 [Metopolophium dirhodum]
MEDIIINNNTIISLLLEEEEEEDEIYNNRLGINKRKSIDSFFTTREEEGFFEILINGHLHNSKPKFREFFRINYDQFMFILSLVKDDITLPPSRRVKKPIQPDEKLAVTLRYLATGESFRSLSFAFRISHSYISLIVKKTLSALKKHLTPIFLPDISTVDFNVKASEFWTKWNFPNCILAIDGKHIRIRSPNNTGSLFFNYKDYFSIVLLAMVDANYKFIAVDIGSFGREGDSGIFLKSNMGKKILDGSFGFPEAKKLPGSSTILPHVIVGDEAFRLHTHIMKPYTRQASKDDKTKSIFNYRLSRARRVTENAFGLLSQVFRVFYQPINIEPSTCDDLITVACCLHNMLRDAYLEENGRAFREFDSREPVPINNIIPIARGGGFANAEGFDVREAYKDFFNNEGAVSWQNNL